MKIALVHPYLNDRGGSQRYAIEISRALKQQLGQEVDIYCYEYNKNACYPELTKELNIQKICTRETSNLGVSYSKIGAIKTVLKAIYKNRIVRNAVNAFGIDYLYSSYLADKRAGYLSDLILSNVKKYDLVFAHEEPLSIWAAIKYKKNSGTPIYWFCYDSIEKWFLEWKFEHKSSALRKALLQNIYFKYDAFIIRKHVNRVAVLDCKMSRRVERLYGIEPLIRRGGVPKEVLNYRQKNYFRERYSLSDDTIVIFSLTRFVDYRRVHDIFEMYTNLPKDILEKIFIFINAPVADTKYYEMCKEKYKGIIDCNNLVVDLLYPNSDDEMYRMYLSSDIFIFPNENQTWGHAPLEAMGCGVAAVVSEGCGIHEVIKDITPDTVYETGNIDSLTNTIVSLIKDDNYKVCAKIQKEYTLNNLTWGKICGQYLEDFNSILSEKHV